MSREYFDIIVVVPLEEELESFFSVFPGIHNRSTPTDLRYIVESGKADVSMLVVQQPGMGKANAIKATSEVLANFDVGLVVCLGIAASLSKDLSLGDVCYSGTIIDVLENAKALDVEDGTLDIALSPTQYETPRNITSALNYIRTFPELKGDYEAWRALQGEAASSLVPQPYNGRKGKEEKLGSPRTLNGTIVCGAVSQSAKYNAKLVALDRKLLAVETEAGGVFDVARSKCVDALCIRGISDYAVDKGDLEDETGGLIRSVAARNAATFLQLQIDSNPEFRRVIGELRSKRTGRAQDLLQPELPLISPVGALIAQIELLTTAKLKELSPEFRLHEKGYRLPLPRIREIDVEAGVKQSREEEAAPVDVIDALRVHQSITITIPRTYPEQSLAWVVCSDLVTQQIGDLQVVPIVVDGSQVRPPSAGIEAAAALNFQSALSMEGTQLVFLVEDAQLSSKTRMQFLAKQAQRYPSAKFVFITRAEVAALQESEFLSLTISKHYALTEISFMEISHFLQKNYELTGSEADVVALRLRETFSRFDLSAHPTYFAGIPKETLTALLQANRRAELIELAVVGFLTFVVADDQAATQLSRTTRSKFLKLLAVQMRLEKRSFDKGELVSYAGEFAKEYDYDIEPIAFINDFIEKGVLHFEDDRVKSSLPFVESYLLASELIANPDLAESYFVLGEADFDVLTFDIYSELGAAPKIVALIKAKLATAVEAFGLDDPKKHILLSNELNPKLILKPDRFGQLQDRIKSAVEAVQENRDESQEKQRIIDVTDRIKGETEQQKKGISNSEENGLFGLGPDFEPAVQTWFLASVLIGSGAERLNGADKREIAQLIIEFGSIMIHRWTTAVSSIDFEEMKRDLTTEEALATFPIKFEGKNADRDMRKLIEDMVEVIEMVVISEPYLRTLNQICSQDDKVLAGSVAKVTMPLPIDSLIHSAWLADIDPAKGVPLLKESLRTLPKSPFLRANLAGHFLRRVYWNHWRKKDRLMLLDAAQEAIEPLNVTINKPQIERMIRNEKPESDG